MNDRLLLIGTLCLLIALIFVITGIICAIIRSSQISRLEEKKKDA